MITRAQYSRKQRRSLRFALAGALQQLLVDTDFYTPDGTITHLSQVFDEWPSPEDNYTTPAACVLPGQGTYEDAGYTPTLLEETWEPKGQPGLGLYKTAELVVPYEIQVRAPTGAERDVIIMGLEDLWVAKGVLMDHAQGARYGILIDMPDYWGVTASFSLMYVRTMDDPDAAMRNHREAVVGVTARADHVKLGPVQPMKLTVRTVITST